MEPSRRVIISKIVFFILFILSLPLWLGKLIRLIVGE